MTFQLSALLFLQPDMLVSFQLGLPVILKGYEPSLHRRLLWGICTDRPMEMPILVTSCFGATVFGAISYLVQLEVDRWCWWIAPEKAIWQRNLSEASFRDFCCVVRWWWLTSTHVLCNTDCKYVIFGVFGTNMSSYFGWLLTFLCVPLRYLPDYIYV